MRGKARPAGLLVLLCAFVVMAIGASSAHAEFGIAKWEALTCNANSTRPRKLGSEKPSQANRLCPRTPNSAPRRPPTKWYRQASGHPNFGITDFELNTLAADPALEGFPDGFIKDNEVHLPEGLNVNPEATPACTIEQAEEGEAGFGECLVATEDGPAAIVGTNYFTVALEGPTMTGCVTGNMHPGPRQSPGLQRRTVRRRPVDGRLPDHDRDRPSSSATSTRPIRA